MPVGPATHELRSDASLVVHAIATFEHQRGSWTRHTSTGMRRSELDSVLLDLNHFNNQIAAMPASVTGQIDEQSLAGLADEMQARLQGASQSYWPSGRMPSLAFLVSAFESELYVSPQANCEC